MGKSIAQKMREAASSTKSSPKAKKQGKEKSRAKKVTKVTKPKTPKFAVTPEFQARAEKEYAALESEKQVVGETYIQWVERCRNFGREKLYKGVKGTDGKFFKTFQDSMRPIFGKSASTIFRDIRITNKLLPVVGESDLMKISKENRESITKLPPTLQGEDKVIKAAQTLTANEFEEKFQDKFVAKKKQTAEVKKTVKQREARQEQFALNVSPELNADFEKAEAIGRKIFFADVVDGDYSETLRAKVWQAILAEFITEHEYVLPEEEVPAF